VGSDPGRSAATGAAEPSTSARAGVAGASAAGRARAPEPLERLRALLSSSRPLSSWSETELLELPRLYRHACTRLAELEAEGEDPRLAAELRARIAAAHGILMVDEPRRRGDRLGRTLELVLRVSPRAIRAEWRLLACSFGLVYGLALLAWLGVRRDLDLAYSLLDPAMVQSEIEQLAALAEGEPFRGNFDFGLGRSPLTAGALMLHNIGIGILFFASALLPPLYLYILSTNGLMLGTYTAVASHWGQASAISSILWTHGVIEIQALVLAGTAGLVLVRAWVRPGPYTRGHAMARESRRALELFTPVIPLLVGAGLIEAFVSPHAPLAVRLAVAGASALALIAWVALGGRRTRGAAQAGFRE
jgi:uncharacterized membrane protein SpoIIM required for sporulation